MNSPANTANVPSATRDATTWEQGKVVRTMKQALRIYFNEAKAEFLMRLRLPGYGIPTILFPLMFYSLFGLSNSQAAWVGTTVGAYLLASYGISGVIALSLFACAFGVPGDR